MLYDGATTAGGPQTIWARRSSDGGATWSARTALSTAGVFSSFPAMESRGAGDVRAFYMQQDGGTRRLERLVPRVHRRRGLVVEPGEDLRRDERHDVQDRAPASVSPTGTTARRRSRTAGSSSASGARATATRDPAASGSTDSCEPARPVASSRRSPPRWWRRQPSSPRRAARRRHRWRESPRGVRVRPARTRSSRSPSGSPIYDNALIAGTVGRTGAITRAPRARLGRRSYRAPRLNDWEPAIAADPNEPWVYIMVARYGSPVCERCPDAAMMFERSRDGGKTWSQGPARVPMRRARHGRPTRSSRSCRTPAPSTRSGWTPGTSSSPAPTTTAVPGPIPSPRRGGSPGTTSLHWS